MIDVIVTQENPIWKNLVERDFPGYSSTSYEKDYKKNNEIIDEFIKEIISANIISHDLLDRDKLKLHLITDTLVFLRNLWKTMTVSASEYFRFSDKVLNYYIITTQPKYAEPLRKYIIDVLGNPVHLPLDKMLGKLGIEVYND
jgi:hypothetical protein